MLIFYNFVSYVQVQSYKDKLGKIISSGQFSNTNNLNNSMTVKQGEKNYYLSFPPSNDGEDYWILQHYKTNEIMDLEPQDR